MLQRTQLQKCPAPEVGQDNFLIEEKKIDYFIQASGTVQYQNVWPKSYSLFSQTGATSASFPLVGNQQNTNKVPILFFTAVWCGACAKLKTLLKTDPSLAALLSHFTIQEVDVDTQQGKSLAREYGVDGFPTLIILGDSDHIRAKLVSDDVFSILDAEMLRTELTLASVSDSRLIALLSLWKQNKTLYVAYQMALEYLKINDIKNAQVCSEAVLSWPPSKVDTQKTKYLLALGEQWEQAGDDKQAFRFYDAVKNLGDETNKGEASRRKAQIYIRQNLSSKAIDELEQLVSTYPESSAAKVIYASICYQHKINLDRAIVIVQKGFEKSQETILLEWLGWLYCAKGDSAAAKGVATELLRQFPGRDEYTQMLKWALAHQTR